MAAPSFLSKLSLAKTHFTGFVLKRSEEGGEEAATPAVNGCLVCSISGSSPKRKPVINFQADLFGDRDR